MQPSISHNQPYNQPSNQTQAALAIDQYPLKNSSILDSGTTIHIFNEITRFLNFRSATDGDFVWAGDSKVAILGYGDIDIEVLRPRNKLHIFRLYDVAYCEGFVTNLVSF